MDYKVWMRNTPRYLLFFSHATRKEMINLQTLSFMRIMTISSSTPTSQSQITCLATIIGPHIIIRVYLLVLTICTRHKMSDLFKATPIHHQTAPPSPHS
jgi:hypothetical protein